LRRYGEVRLILDGLSDFAFARLRTLGYVETVMFVRPI
jgi:hypothetical protein